MKYTIHLALLGSTLFLSSLTTTYADSPDKDPNAPLSSIHFTPNGMVIIDEDGYVETIQGSVIIVDKENAISVDSDGNSIYAKTIDEKTSIKSTASGKKAALSSNALTGTSLYQSVLPAEDGICHITTTLSGETTCRDVDPYFGYCFYPRYPGKCPT